MQSFAFIGSDKNAGKTTALNFIYNKIVKENKTVCLTSIGINGEEFDYFDNQPKPLIVIYKNSYFVTADENLKQFDGKYESIHLFSTKDFTKSYVFAKALSDITLLLEGPNTKSQIIAIKERVSQYIPECYFLIDGSADRQFIGHPEVSDAIYFALLISDRKHQVEKAKKLLLSLFLKPCSNHQKEFILSVKEDNLKSLIFDQNHHIIYKGYQVPCFDDNLKEEICIKERSLPIFLYINGALTKSFYKLLCLCKDLNVILDNFTLHLNTLSHNLYFEKNLKLLNYIPVKQIFIKQEGRADKAPFLSIIKSNMPEYKTEYKPDYKIERSYNS